MPEDFDFPLSKKRLHLLRRRVLQACEFLAISKCTWEEDMLSLHAMALKGTKSLLEVSDTTIYMRCVVKVMFLLFASVVASPFLPAVSPSPSALVSGISIHTIILLFLPSSVDDDPSH